jgi:hypothetical protein
MAKLPSGQVVKWKEDIAFPMVYANLMGFTMTPFDITILLGLVGDSTPTEVTGIPQAKILLAPEQAENLMKLLGLALNAYVASNGPLRTSGSLNLDDIERQLNDSKVAITSK